MIEREVYSLYPDIEQEYAISRAIKVGSAIYLTGMTAFNEAGEIVGIDDMQAQFRQIYSNMQKALQHFGADLDHIVEQYVFTTDINRIGECVTVVKDLWGEGIYPTAVGVEVSKLAMPEMLVEVKATAHL